MLKLNVCLGRVSSSLRVRRLSVFTIVRPLSIGFDGLKIQVKEVDFESLFRSCTCVRILKKLHAQLLVSGRAQSIYISTRIVNLYARLGDLNSSRKIFAQMPTKDSYTWNSMISAYVRVGRFREAVNHFYEMVSTSLVKPDWYTFAPVLKACGRLLDGEKIHSWVFKLGFMWDVYVAASLIHMYSRFGMVDAAQKIFYGMQYLDSASWNAMISGLCQNNRADEALDVVSEMLVQGKRLDPVTVACVLPACAQVGNLLSGMLVHLYVIKHGLEYDVFVSNALINMYGKFSYLDHAQMVFDEMPIRDLVSWNSIIASYEQNNDPASALCFSREMKLHGFQPDRLTVVSLASITAQSGYCENTAAIHAFVMRNGWLMEDVIVGNAIIDMYAKLGNTEAAHKVFDLIPVKDIISWNTLITGYSQNGFASEAVEVFQMMEESTELVPQQGTWVSILPAYSHLGALRQGMKVHGRVIKTPLYTDVFVGTCLIDMYGKCGQLGDALSLFHEVSKETSIPWNAVISCHGVHGHGQVVLDLFEQMIQERVKPDHVTFLSLLSACSHSGLVDQGNQLFYQMQELYNIRPNLRHYGCMVDLLGRAGKLSKAFHFIENMPVQPDASVWGALLGACRIHGNIELGKFASDRLFEIDPQSVGYYVLLSNMYANAGRWEGVNNVRILARDRGLNKTPGWSSIEVNNKVDVFYTGNKSHPKSEEIYQELAILMAKMKSLGFASDYSYVLQDVEEDEKVHILNSHSERLAIALGIISTPPKSTLRIFKNLRVCGDCHSVTKFISKITEREIIVRDSNRFHHFRDGIFLWRLLVK